MNLVLVNSKIAILRLLIMVIIYAERAVIVPVKIIIAEMAMITYVSTPHLILSTVYFLGTGLDFITANSTKSDRQFSAP